MPSEPRFRSALPLLLSAVLLVGACGGDDPDAHLRSSPGYDSWKRGVEQVENKRPDLALADLQQARTLDPDEPRFLTELAGCLMRLGRYPEAHQLLEEGAKSFPGDPEVAFHLGSLYRRISRLDDSIRWFTQATELDPESAKAYFALGLSLYDRSVLFLGTTAVDFDKLDRAIAAFERAVELDGTNAEQAYRLGLARFQRQDMAGAIAAWEQAVQLDPEHLAANRELGMLYTREGRLEEARARLEQALLVDREDEETHYQMGLLMEEMDDLASALRSYDAAIELRRSYPEPHFRRTNVLRRLGRGEEADASQVEYDLWWKAEQELESHRLAAYAAPNDSSKLYRYGMALLDVGRLEEAETMLQRVEAMAPESPGAPYGLGRIAWIQERLPEARRHMERANELVPGDPTVQYELARILLALEEYEEALPLLEEAVDEFDDPRVRIDLAAVCSRLDETERAIAELETVLETHPQNAKALFKLAGVHAQRRDLDAAIEQYERLIAIAPDYPRAKEMLEGFRKLRDEERAAGGSGNAEAGG